MTFPRASRLSAVLLLCAPALMAQQQTSSSPSAPLTLSPRAAYEDAMHPLDEARRAISNWSGAELSALTLTLSRARAACKERNPSAYSGADLIELARLCALGQEWGTVVLTTSLYIDETAATKPQLAEAHAARVDADLHLRSEQDALRDTHAMFAAVPYSPIVAEASTEAIEYMRFSASEDAIAIATEREPLIVQQVRASSAPGSSVAPTNVAATTQPSLPETSPKDTAAAKTKLTIQELYAQGLALATLLQQADKSALAQAIISDLDKALPAALPVDDSLRIAEDRKRYALLGKPLPTLKLVRSLSMPNIIPAIPAVNTVTALLLFPDWCAQCINSMAQIPETVSAVEGHSAYYFGLLAETVPEKELPAKQSSAEIFAAFQPGYAAALLAEKPVLTVSASTPATFSASDYPFLVITDVKGVVRVAQAVDADDLNSGGKVDAAVLLVSKHWPLPSMIQPPVKPEAAGSAAHRTPAAH